MHRYLMTSVAAFALGIGAASAADLGRAPAPVYTKAPLAVPFSWTGFYVGVNGGYGWSSSNDDITYTAPNGFTGTSQGFDPKGGFGGAQLGYNWQFSQIVLGLETDVEGSGIKDAFNVTVPANNGSALGVDASQKLDYFGTVRGRLGYAFDRALVYGTGGFAYGDVKDSILLTNGASTALLANSHVDTGFVVGGGIEYAFAPAWSAKVEYQFIDLQTQTLTGVSTNNVSLTTNAINDRFQTVRAGVNYRFGGN